MCKYGDGTKNTSPPKYPFPFSQSLLDLTKKIRVFFVTLWNSFGCILKSNIEENNEQKRKIFCCDDLTTHLALTLPRRILLGPEQVTQPVYCVDLLPSWSRNYRRVFLSSLSVKLKLGANFSLSVAPQGPRLHTLRCMGLVLVTVTSPFWSVRNQKLQIQFLLVGWHGSACDDDFVILGKPFLIILWISLVVSFLFPNFIPLFQPDTLPKTHP